MRKTFNTSKQTILALCSSFWPLKTEKALRKYNTSHLIGQLERPHIQARGKLIRHIQVKWTNHKWTYWRVAITMIYQVISLSGRHRCTVHFYTTSGKIRACVSWSLTDLKVHFQWFCLASYGVHSIVKDFLQSLQEMVMSGGVEGHAISGQRSMVNKTTQLGKVRWIRYGEGRGSTT